MEKLIFRSCLVLGAAFICFVRLSAQDMPAEIRGYKVANAKVDVRSTMDPDPADADAIVVTSEPALTNVGLTGLRFEIGGEITAKDQSGTIDLLSFEGVRVNGIAVAIDDYVHPFAFKHGVAVKLPFPVGMRVGDLGVVAALYHEVIESRPTWIVSGTCLVYGKFKRYGMSFKRVVPVKFAITINNPLRSRGTRQN